MTELVVISGKGGAGKTSLAASFATLAQRPVIAACDVDAADLHILLRPRVMIQEKYFGGRSPQVDLEKCTRCGLCTDVCRFDA
ncbi:MAG: 4Fe-4S binding protein, partial [candidate division WOR-3 bacterium]